MALRTRTWRPAHLGWLTRPAAVVPGVAAACQVATVLVTWRLWAHRAAPPNLPVVHVLSRVSYGIPLVAAALACLVVPRLATPVFLAVLGTAVLGDQTRLQPEVVSLALLMALPLLGPNGIRICRWHLTSVWLWSGVNKILSTGWSTGGAGFIASSLHIGGSRWLVAVALPAAEIVLGVTSLWRRTWAVTRWGALAVHLGILVTLSPLFANWNSSVWPWNVALACAGFLLFQPAGADRPVARYAVVASAVLIVAPALFYVGLADAYLSHNLYTGNTAEAVVCQRRAACSGQLFDTWGALNVPLPPEERLYRQLFDRSCVPGSRLVVTGRATVFTDPPDHSTFLCRRRAR